MKSKETEESAFAGTHPVSASLGHPIFTLVGHVWIQINQNLERLKN
jgi:hypothetical protein